MSQPWSLARSPLIALPLVITLADKAFAQAPPPPQSIAVWKSATAPEELAVAVLEFDPAIAAQACIGTLADCDINALTMQTTTPSGDPSFSQVSFTSVAFEFDGSVNFTNDLVGQAGFGELSLSGASPSPNSAAPNTLTLDGGSTLDLVSLKSVANGTNGHVYPTVLTMNEDTSDTELGTTIFAALSTAGSAITSCAGAAGLGVVDATGGDVTFTPTAETSGVDTFTCETDTGDTIAFIVKVLSVNDTPTAAAASLTTNEDTDAPLDLAASVSDVETADADLVISITTAPTKGTVAVNGTQITYTPNANANGADSFDYTVTDEGSATASNTVSVTITAVNDAPDATADAITLNEDDPTTQIDVLSNDTDAEGTALTLTTCTAASNGTATVNGNLVDYTPDADFNGVDTFSCTISDGLLTATALVTVTVTAVNDAPDANDDTITLNEDDPTTQVNLLANDTDVEGHTLSISSCTAATSGTATLNGNVVDYTPSAHFNGVATFSCTISDGNGGSATELITVNITSVNDVPVATQDNITIAEDSGMTTIDILNNDTDADGDTLTISSCTIATNGAVNVNGNMVEYTPNGNFDGTANFNCTISDGNGGSSTAQVSVLVTSVNDQPVAAADTASMSEDGGALQIDILDNDSDIDLDNLVISICTDPANGTATINGGFVDYTPDADFNGADTFDCTISDNNGGTATAQVTVTVTPVNDAPVATADSATTNEDVTVQINILSNDTDVDAGDTLSVSGCTSNNGSATVNGAAIDYTPGADFNGTDTFDCTITDGALTALAQVTVTVNPVNDAPVANADTLSVPEDSSATVQPLLNDTDVDAGDTLSIQGCTDGAFGTTSVDAGTGVVTYTTTDPDYVGADSFDCTIEDGSAATDFATVTVTITEVNDPPTASGATLTLDEDTSNTVDVSGLVSDIEDAAATLVISVTGAPANGTTTVAGQIITYTPTADYQGGDSFVYQVTDSDGATATATVTVTVNNVNDAPDAVNDAQSTQEDTAVTFNVLTNDSDIDPADSLTLVSCSSANTSVNPNGDVTYTPAADFFGVDTFTCVVEDLSNAQSTATVTLTVTSVNDLPTTTNTSITTDEDVMGTVDVSGDLGDIEDNPATMTLSIKTQPSNGTASVQGQVVRYLGDADYNGLDSFVYTVTDSNGGQADATVIVTVTPVNDSPVANDDSMTADEETSTNFDIISNDTDIDGNTLSIVDCTNGAQGVVSVIDAVTVQYTGTLNYFGPDSFTCDVTDGNLTVTSTVDVTVINVNDPPAPADDDVEAREGTVATFNITANDSEFDNQAIWIDSCADGLYGTTTISGGSVTYTHNGVDRDDDSFDCVITDGALTATTTVTVDVIYCGDGVKQSPEECDDGNLNNCDACTNACKVGPDIKMVNITGGGFTMGDKAYAGSSPTRTVTVPDFQVSRAEITVAQYRSCVKSGGCTAAAQLTGCTYKPSTSSNDSRPVNCVSWSQAKAFMSWCGAGSSNTALSLPTEAQWEFLAKGGDGGTNLYPSGNASPARTQSVWYASAPANVCSVGAATVGGLKVQGPFNLCNMVGNVSEWVEDNYGAYSSSSPTDGSAVTLPNAYRVVRGGSWNSKRDSYLLSVYRIPLLQTQQRPEVGFRVMCPVTDDCGFIGDLP